MLTKRCIIIAIGGRVMPRFRLMEEHATRSIVFERSELLQLEEYAAAQRRSLSSVIREAVARFLAEVVNLPPNDGNRNP
jgi:DNA-binding ferritin-like protein (Dps family)